MSAAHAGRFARALVASACFATLSATIAPAAPVERGGFDTVSGARAAAVDTTGDRLWVADAQNDRVHILDLETGATVAVRPSGWFPLGIAIDESLRRVWVTNNPADDVSVFDADSFTEIARIGVARMPLDVDVDPVAHRVLVASGDGLNQPTYITVLDGRSMRVVQRIAFGSSNLTLELDPQRRRAFVLDWHAGTLTALHLDSLEVIATVSGVRGQALAFDPALNALYLGSECTAPGWCQDGVLEVFDAETLTKTATQVQEGRVHAVEVSRTTGTLALGTTVENAVDLLEPETLARVALFPQTSYPSVIVHEATRSRFVTILESGEIRTFDEDTTAPTVSVDPPPVRPLLTAVDVLSGTATDDITGIESVRVTYRDVLGQVETRDATLVCGVRTTCTWSSTLPATPGIYDVEVAATDVAGNGPATATTRVTVLL